MTHPEKAYVNGIVYHVIAAVPQEPLGQANNPRVQRLVYLRRPNGTREYLAQDFGPHPLYGENRRYVVLGA